MGGAHLRFNRILPSVTSERTRKKPIAYATFSISLIIQGLRSSLHYELDIVTKECLVGILIKEPSEMPQHR
jgi:hypothetical protein